MKRNIKELIFLVLIYCVLIFCWGYDFGQGDLIQLEPLALYAHDNSLFANDFYIQHAIENYPNERSFFMLLLIPFGNAMEISSFLLQFIFSVILLWGLLRITQLLFKNKLYCWLTLLVLFIPLYNINLGDNELYYGIFHPSLASKAISAWAIYLWLKKNNFAAYFLLVFSTLLHPLAGVQVFLLITVAEFILCVAEKQKFFSGKNTAGIILYILTAGVFLFLIEKRFNDMQGNESGFFYIFYVFRNPHHFIPTAFPVTSWIILTPLFISAPFILFARNKKIFLYSILVIAGCIIYSIGVLNFQSETFASTQWFKSTIWLEFFSVVALFLLIERIFPFFNSAGGKKIAFIISVPAFIILILFFWPGLQTIKNFTTYNLPFLNYTSPEIDISRKAKQLTPADALFIQPCGFSSLKYYGERSSCFDFKALTHEKSFITEWAARFEDIYNVDIYNMPKGLAACNFADANFKKLTADEINILKAKYHFTYILTSSESNLPYEVIAQNEKYKIYKL